MSSSFSNNNGSVFHWLSGANYTSTVISNCSFIDNSPGKTQEPILSLTVTSPNPIVIDLVDVKVSNCSGYSTTVYPFGSGVVCIVLHSSESVLINFTRVSLQLNKYLGYNGGTVYITPVSDTGNAYVLLSYCDFFDSSSSGHGAVLYVRTDYSTSDNPSVSISIVNCLFRNSVAVESVVYVEGVNLTVCSSSFVSNTASSLHLSASDLKFCGSIVFENNMHSRQWSSIVY